MAAREFTSLSVGRRINVHRRSAELWGEAGSTASASYLHPTQREDTKQLTKSFVLLTW